MNTIKKSDKSAILELSVVIPVWNESNKITADLDGLVEFITQQPYRTEIIVVDDGSRDGTPEVVNQFKQDHEIALKLIHYAPHRGKGYAIRQGMQVANGDVILFMDSGRTVPLRFINESIKRIQEGCELVLGTRHHRDSRIIKNLSWKRRVSSFLFRKVVRYYLPIPRFLSDTQCGFKLFSRQAAARIFPKCNEDGFLLDMECILHARQSGFRICELPIDWRCDRDSRLSLSRSLFPVLREIRKLKNTFSQKK